MLAPLNALAPRSRPSHTLPHASVTGVPLALPFAQEGFGETPSVAERLPMQRKRTGLVVGQFQPVKALLTLSKAQCGARCASKEMLAAST